MRTVSFEQTESTVTATAAELLAEKIDRDYLLIQNNGAETLYVNFSTDATTANGVAIPTGEAYEPVPVPSNAISAISASGSLTVVTLEG